VRHNYLILRAGRFLTGEYSDELGVKDVTWISASG
jgi:isoamylase